MKILLISKISSARATLTLKTWKIKKNMFI